MSYPPPRYSGDRGEVSAAFRPHDHPFELAHASGGGAAYLATGAMTRGQFGLYRWDMGPGVSGPDPHFHRTISESFLVLSGTVRLYDGTGWVDGTPGDFLFVPEGGIHAFRNESGEPASMLILFTPGAPREAYFEAMTEIATSGRQLSKEEWTELYRRHDQYMV